MTLWCGKTLYITEIRMGMRGESVRGCRARAALQLQGLVCGPLSYQFWAPHAVVAQRAGVGAETLSTSARVSSAGARPPKAARNCQGAE